MLDLKVAHESLDLLPGSSITIDEESPVFEKDSIPGGYSYPFSLPITPRNRRILGFPDRIEKAGAMTTDKPFELFHSGRLIFSGTISVSEASDQYKAYLLISTGDLASKIQDKKLKDIDFGGLRTWAWKSEYTYPTDDFTLAPMFNVKFYEGSEFADYFTDQKYKVNSYESGSFNIASGNAVFVTSPFPFLNYVLKQVFKYAGINIIENVLESDPDFRDLILYTIRDLGSWQINYGVESVVIGYNQDGTPIYANAHTGNFVDRVINPFDLADCMPDITIADFLKSIRNLLNINFVISGDSVAIIKRTDLLQVVSTKDITQSASRQYTITSGKVDGFKLEWITEGDDVLWGSDFFTRIDDVLGYLGDPVDTVADLESIEPEPNEIRYVADVDLYFRWIYFQYDPEDTTKYRWQWVAWSYNYQNYLSGDMEDVFSSKVAPILMTQGYHDNTKTGVMRLPQAEQKGNFPAKTEATPFQLRLLFYRGMMQDSLGNSYPYATNDNLDRTGNVLAGKSLALRWDGEYGLYNQLWKGYMNWWVNKKVVKVTIADPSILDFATKYAIDGKHYLLKNRTVNLTSRGVEPGECEFYLV